MRSLHLRVDVVGISTASICKTHSERLAHPFFALGGSVGLSRNNVYQPVKALKEHGTITNSSAIVDLDEFGLTLLVLIQMGISYHDVEWWKTILDS